MFDALNQVFMFTFVFDNFACEVLRHWLLDTLRNVCFDVGLFFLSLSVSSV